MLQEHNGCPTPPMQRQHEVWRNTQTQTHKYGSLFTEWTFLLMANRVDGDVCECFERKATLLLLCVTMSSYKEQSPSRRSEMTPSS